MSSRISVERVSIAFALALTAASILIAGTPVRADEAYLCGKDRIVYVAVADLERMKRTDSCIAAYYGLKVVSPEGALAKHRSAKQLTSASPAEANPAPPQAQERAPEVPAKNVPATLAKVAPAAMPALKRLDDETLRSPSAPSKLALVAAPGTDFRNVKVLNASSPSDAIYHHAR